MAHWPLRSRPQKVVSQMRGASSNLGPVSVAAAGSSHTKGSWTEIVSSTAADATTLVLYVGDSATSATATSQLLDIGFGAGGSEVVKIANIATGYVDAIDQDGRIFIIPMSIPAGTRIAARLQGLIASDTLNVAVDLWGGTPLEGLAPWPNTFDTIGADTSVSKGVVLTAGSANVKGSWAQLTASTSRAYRGFILCVQGNASAAITSATQLLDIGVGGAGSETVLIADIAYRVTASEIIQDIKPATVWMVDRPVPASSRLAARISSSTGSQTCDLVLIGIP